MAAPTKLLTYQAVGNREDLTDLVTTITLHETPLFSNLQKVKANGTYHEWQIDTLSTGSDNANVEGADFSFAQPAVRTRTGAYTQIFAKTVAVSETQQSVSTAGVDDEFAYQMEKRMKEIATDVEKALITGTGNSGASGTARRLKGILAFITTNVETGTGTGTEALTETMYNNLLQTIWAAGGRPDNTYVNGWQMRKIAGFTTSNTRYLEMRGEGRLENFVNVYQSNFGIQKIHLNSFMDTDKLIALENDKWAVAQLRPIAMRDTAYTGDAKRGVLIGELTLEARNEAASGKITGLTTS